VNAAATVRKVHATDGHLTLHTPTGARHRCRVTRVSADGNVATFEWTDRHGTPHRVTLRIA
jgi:hypothetical protein